MDMKDEEMGMDKKMMRMEFQQMMGIRMLTAVIVIIFAFWCGFQFGENRASVQVGHGGFGTMDMMGGPGDNVVYGVRSISTSAAMPQAGATTISLQGQSAGGTTATYSQ